MRVLVGTLEQGEPQLARCVAAINSQSHRNFEHLVISNQPNKAAHDQLYRTFSERAHEFDLLVKIDADMVLAHENVLADIVERFRQNPELDRLLLAVQDYFTDRPIMGINTYSNRVKWQQQTENVFVDRDAMFAAPERTQLDWDYIAAAHSHNPSTYQAFYFGAHKGIKVREAIKRLPGKAREHLANIEALRAHFERTNRVELAWAMLGAERALRGDYRPEHLNCNDSHLASELKVIKDEQLKKLIREARGWRAFLPARFAYNSRFWGG